MADIAVATNVLNKISYAVLLEQLSRVCKIGEVKGHCLLLEVVLVIGRDGHAAPEHGQACAS